MIDTGAKPNVIKESAVIGKIEIERNDACIIKGVTPGTVNTLGSVEISLLGRQARFLVVPDDFPIEADGLLGGDFIPTSALVSYKDNCLTWGNQRIPFSNVTFATLPPRSNVGIKLALSPTDRTEGYIPRIDIHPGVFFGEVILKNISGYAYARITNANEEEIEVKIPAITLEDYENFDDAHITVNDDGILATRRIADQNKRTSKHPLDDSPSLGPGDASSPDKQESPSSGHEHTGKNTTLGSKQSHISYVDTTECETGDLTSAVIAPCTRDNNERIKELFEALRWTHLNAEETEHVKNLVIENADLFHLPHERLTKTNAVTHTIRTRDEIPTHTRQYRHPQVHKEEINRQVGELLDRDIIKPSSSPWNSPVLLVAKKADSKGQKRWRMVIDYRKLNEKSLSDAYPLPNITEVLDQLGSAKYFSVLDLASGFHQIGMDEKDAPKTAFSTAYGHYEFTRMPFGLKNGPATFQRLMNNVLTGLQGNELFVYLDDVVIYASSLQDHIVKFRKLADRFRAANLRLQPDKCEFLRKEVVYLGHIISGDGVKPNPLKVSAVRDFPTPKNATNIKQFLGLAGYYRRFISRFSYITKPLTELLKKDVEFNWQEEQEKAFNTIKELLCTEPILQYPDFTKPFVLTTDASGYAIGGILSQGKIGEDLPIAYTSRVLNDGECKFSTTEKELLAIVYCVKHFRPYLYGKKFTLVTDHKPLIYINNMKDPTSRLARWRIILEDYEYDITYKAGKKNVNADALSRNPVRETTVCPMSYSSDEAMFDMPETEVTTQLEQIHLPESPGIPSSPVIPESSPENKRKEIKRRRKERSPTPNLPTPIEEISESSPAMLDDDEETDTTDEPMFEPPSPAYNYRDVQLIEVKDRITMRKDNVAFFITAKGEACDTGSRELAEASKLPEFKDITLGRAKVHRAGSRFLIGLPVKESQHTPVDWDILKETMASLLDVANELQLETISFAQTFIGNIHWPEIKKVMKLKFLASQTKLIICTSEIIIPPAEKREQIIREKHCSPIGGHKGVTKTYGRIREKYYWPQLKIDVQKFCQQCESCQLNKLTRLKTRQPLVLTDTPGKAFDKIAMDIVGPLPTTPAGHSHILTIQDLLTKYSLAIPLRETTSVDIADAFVNHFICRFGAPKAILTDQGANFTSSLMRAVAKKFRITQCRTTAFHPQSNGSIERSHHVLVEYLKHYVERNNWDEWLPMAMFSYNTSIHEGTRHAPHELVFGCTARVPTDSEFEIESQEQTYLDYLFGLQTKLGVLQDNARKNLDQAKLKSKKYYDAKARVREFQPDDYVYVLKEPRKGKLDAQYVGPYRVLANLGKHNIKILIKGKRRVIHANRLKLAQKGAAD